MHLPSAATTPCDRQDVINQLLAATLQTRATIKNVLHAAAVSPTDQPQAAADLTEAAIVLARVHDSLLRAATVDDEDAGG